ncbi:MAG TPA: hypothetical protein VNJ08_01465 [Bacteriovoracaceae bacterium]|nr:hypothetical protein [Bacteriovoracaceae bacterium]
MKSYKEQLESLGYVIKKEIQYWSCEHAGKKIYHVKTGELEEVCSFWWEQFEAASSKAA